MDIEALKIDTTDPVEEYLNHIVLAGTLFGWGRQGDGLYRSYEELILDRGRHYDGAPRPKGMRKQQNKQCFRNTLRLCQIRPGLRYVEGYACGIIPVQHAWAIDEDDRVIDLTWDKPEEASYYGLVIPTSVACRLAIKHGCYGVLGSDYRLGAPLLVHGTFFPPEG